MGEAKKRGTFAERRDAARMPANVCLNCGEPWELGEGELVEDRPDHFVEACRACGGTFACSPGMRAKLGPKGTP